MYVFSYIPACACIYSAFSNFFLTILEFIFPFIHIYYSLFLTYCSCMALNTQ